MRYALHAEWTKMRTLAGPAWLLLATLLLTIGVGAAVTDSAAGAALSSGGGDTATLSLAGVQLSQAVVAILAVQAITGEYSCGLIRTTLVAMPKRMTAYAAKAVIVSALTLSAALPASAVSLLVGRLLLHGHGFAMLPLGSGAMLRAGFGSALYLTLIALLGLGIGTMVRDTGVAIGAVLGLLYLFPVLARAIGDSAWERHLEQLGPMTAGLLVQSTTRLQSLPLTPWEGLGVLACWAVGALGAGAALLERRDA